MIFTLKLILILVVKSAAFGVIGYSWFGLYGLVASLLLSLAIDVFFLFYCDQTLIKYLDAKVADSFRFNILGASGLQRFVHSLAYQMDLPTPEVLIFKEQKPLVYILGRSRFNAKVLISSGALQMLSHEELKSFLTVCLKRIALGGILPKTMLASMLFKLNSLMFGQSEPQLNIRLIACVIIVPYWWMLSRLAFRAEVDYLVCDKEAAQLTGAGSVLAEALSRVDVSLSYAQRRTHQFAFLQATGFLAVVNPMTRYPLFAWLQERSKLKFAKNAGFGRGVSGRTSQLLDVQNGYSRL